MKFCQLLKVTWLKRSADVYLLPPGDDQNPDEDSGKENYVDVSINNLTSFQLIKLTATVITRHDYYKTRLFIDVIWKNWRED